MEIFSDLSGGFQLKFKYLNFKFQIKTSGTLLGGFWKLSESFLKAFWELLRSFWEATGSLLGASGKLQKAFWELLEAFSDLSGDFPELKKQIFEVKI